MSFPQSSTGRLPSLTGDSFSTLNMGHLNSSLPTPTAQERRLPTPFMPQYMPTPYSTSELPEIRPLGSFSEPRAHIHGIHSRNALPWSQDSGVSYGASRSGSLANLGGLPGGRVPTPSELQTTAAVSEPVLGYPFATTSNNSPDVSPASGSSLTESFQSTSGSSTASMLPPSGGRYSTGQTPTLPPLTMNEYPEPSRTHHAAAASLYTFSHDSPDRYATALNRTSGDNSTHLTGSSSSYVASPPSPPRQPQTQHPASIDALRRQSSFEQQQRAATAHRMSFSNLNGHY